MSTMSMVVIGLNLAWLVPFIVYMVKHSQKSGQSRDRRARLLETGQPARAEILSVEEVGPYYNHVPHLSFRVRVEGTPTFEATALGFFQRIQYPSLQPGLRVDVKYDPADPTTVAIVGDKLA